MFTTRAAAVTCSGPSVAMPDGCGVRITSPTISCTVPSDAQQASPLPYIVQRATNIFSWQAFVGLQWLAAKTGRGQPDPAQPLGAPGPTV